MSSVLQVGVQKRPGDSEQTLQDKLLLGQLIRKGTSGCRIDITGEDRGTERVQLRHSKVCVWAEYPLTVTVNEVLQLGVP